MQRYRPMRISQLDALEARWNAGVFRVIFKHQGRGDCCPSLKEGGVTLDEAMQIKNRIITIAPLKGIDVTSVHVIGPDGLLVDYSIPREQKNDLMNNNSISQDNEIVIKQTLNSKQLKGLSNLDNVDLSLLVNPEALEYAGDTDDD